MDHKQITNERLQSWEKRCNDTEATPVIMVTVGITKKSMGKLGVIVTEDRTNDEIKLFLRHVIAQL